MAAVAFAALPRSATRKKKKKVMAAWLSSPSMLGCNAIGQRSKKKKRRRRQQPLLPSPSSLRCSATRKKEEEEGNGSHAAVTFFLFFLHYKQEEEEKKRKRLTWVPRGSCSGSKLQTLAVLLQALAPPPSSSSSSSKLQAPQVRPPSSKLLLHAPSRATFLELWQWSEVGGR